MTSGAPGPSPQWVYDRLYAHFGPQHWWPARTPFEVCVGAILTQAVSWKNVQQALHALETSGLLSPKAIAEAPHETLADLIRPTRYFNQKTRRLQGFCRHLMEHYGGDLTALFARPTPQVRAELLSLWGIGEETADSMLLYAGGHPVFVVDAYTRRLTVRLGLCDESIRYGPLQQFYSAGLPRDRQVYNEFHALIVALGQATCTATEPRCSDCPLATRCSYAGTLAELKEVGL